MNDIGEVRSQETGDGIPEVGKQREVNTVVNKWLLIVIR